MVKYDPGPGALLHQLKSRNRVDARWPAARSPSLHDSLVRYKFDLSSRDVPTEESERATRLETDLGGLVSPVHGLHDPAELYDLVELFGVGERFVHALAARFDNGLLVNGFRGMRNFILGSRPSLNR